MPRSSDVVVQFRNMRWEVRAEGLTRPLVDWFATKDRAIDHAFERAVEVGGDAVVVEAADGSVERVLPVKARRRAG